MYTSLLINLFFSECLDSRYKDKYDNKLMSTLGQKCRYSGRDCGKEGGKDCGNDGTKDGDED